MRLSLNSSSRQSPVGKSFVRGGSRYEVVGLVHDAPYRSMREAILPVAFVPLRSVNASGVLQPVSTTSLIVRTVNADPTSMASKLRREVVAVRGGMRVSNARGQADLVRAQTLRERLLAMLALFFAVVAVLLSGVGLYGVLDYSVLQRRQEIGIRMAIGARAGDVAVGVTVEAFWMVLAGALVGLAAGVGPARYVEGLLYQVKATDCAALHVDCGGGAAGFGACGDAGGEDRPGCGSTGGITD